MARLAWVLPLQCWRMVRQAWLLLLLLPLAWWRMVQQAWLLLLLLLQAAPLQACLLRH